VASVPEDRILIVGGAGFIGSHMVLALQEAGYQPIVLDNLSKGHRDAVLGAELIVGEMGDRALLDNLFSTHKITAVMHFASFIEVGESVLKPMLYYQNNVAATLNLLDIMLEHRVKTFIFSSTAAVYGEPEYVPIDEVHPLKPINPYGRSKCMIEAVLADLAKSDDLRYASLRYFNAAGADPRGRLRERHDPESHLIPIVLQVAAGLREAVTVYGRDYPTEDGTCIRDYVHVHDLCYAHLLALEVLQKNKTSFIYNLGIGHGYSVQQIIEAARRVTGHAIPTKDGARRPGDPAVLLANIAQAKSALGWKPVYTDLDIIVSHAWSAML
jgi:UDP-glucose 4-epimerase